MGTTRFVEPRLTGGFQHGRLIVLRSSAPQGLDAQSPAVLAAVARIRERTEGDTSPEALGALAVTYLVSGDITKAVKALESATAQAPKNPRLLSDLAAAYLVRASRLDEPADLPKALEAAEKAIELEDAPAEAWFNRALALEQLHLVDSAKKAWEDFLQRDSTSGWADEARKHLEELPPAQQSTIEEDRARARAALAEGPAAIDRLADEAPSILSDYFLGELLPTLGRRPAHRPPERPHASHARPSRWAKRSSEPRATRCRATPPLPSQRPLRARPATRPACRPKATKPSTRRNASTTSGNGPATPSANPAAFCKMAAVRSRSWARERIVVACLYPKTDPSVLPELTQMEGAARQKQYGKLLGRALWMTALFHSDAGDFDRALQHYRRAGDVFRALRDSESQSSVALRLSFVLNASGDSRAGWRERLRALALLDTVKQPTRREEALFLIAVACWQDRLARGAVHALTELADATRRRDSPDRLAYALTWRGQVLHDLGQQERAAADLAAARSILNSAGDIAYADNIEAFADAAEGRILESAQPERALECLQRALRYFEPMIPSFVPSLRVDLARVLRARGREGEAEAELDAAIRQIESQRSPGDAQQQVLFFDYAAAAPFDEMVTLQLDARDDPLRALQYVERSRGWQLTASLRSLPRANLGRTPSATPTGPAPLAPDSIQRQLPAGVVLLYYVVLPDRLVAWVSDQKSSSVFRLAAAPEGLERRAGRLRLRARERGACFGAARAGGTPVRRTGPSAAPSPGGARFARAHTGRLSAIAVVCQPLEP